MRARRALVIRLRAERREEYLAQHRAVWPQVQQAMRQAGHHNYSIFLRDELLFCYFEHDATVDIDQQRAAMRGLPELQPWLELMNACQQPIASAGPNEWWASMEEVYHLD